MEPKGSFEDFSLFLTPGTTATAAGTEDKQTTPEPTTSSRKATSSKRIIKRNTKLKDKASSKSLKTPINSPAHESTSPSATSSVKINIVGKPTHPTILLQQFTGNKSASLPFTATVRSPLFLSLPLFFLQLIIYFLFSSSPSLLLGGSVWKISQTGIIGIQY